LNKKAAGIADAVRERAVNKKGFTVIEVSICLALLIIVLLAMVYLITENLYVEQSNREKVLALNFARKMMEDIKSHAYSDISQDNFPAEFDVSENNIELMPPAGAAHCGSCIIGDEDAEGTKNITIVIQWQSARGKPLSIRLETCVTNR